jgi:hypothetical protein
MHYISLLSDSPSDIATLHIPSFFVDFSYSAYLVEWPRFLPAASSCSRQACFYLLPWKLLKPHHLCAGTCSLVVSFPSDLCSRLPSWSACKCCSCHLLAVSTLLSLLQPSQFACVHDAQSLCHVIWQSLCISCTTYRGCTMFCNLQCLLGLVCTPII